MAISLKNIKLPNIVETDIPQQFIGPFLIQNNSSIIPDQLVKACQWTSGQNYRYTSFLQTNSDEMEGKSHAKLWPLYERMAKVVKSRNFRQCKLHHQRMLRKFKNIRNIMAFLSKGSENNVFLVNSKKEECFGSGYKMNDGIENYSCSQDKLLPATDGSYQAEEAQKYGSTYYNSSQMMKSRNSLSYFENRERQSSWKQCHNLFIKWTSMLQSILLSSGLP